MYECILLPVSNPKNSEFTLKAALRLLNPGGRLILFAVVSAQENYPQRNRTYREKTELVIRLMKEAQSLNFEVEVTPEVARATSIYDAVLQQSTKHNAELIILGYSLRSTLYKLRYGDVIYPILKNATPDVILSNFKYESSFERILIPSAGFKHSLAAFKIAKVLAEQVSGHITLLHVTEESESDVQADLKRLTVTYQNSSIEIKSGSVAEQIMSMAKDYDLLIMGASERSRGTSILFGTVVDRVIERTPINTLIVRV